ncbi:MAG: hypothetical protein ACI4LO_00690, partial [Anaerovoracaceae bacterium]
MEIMLKKLPKSGAAVFDIKEGTKLSEIAAEVQGELPYPVLGALVNNELTALDEEIKAPCTVELIDMRNPNGNLMYQNGISLVYLKAVKDVLGLEAAEKTEIQNSINKGFYTVIRRKEGVTEEEISAVAGRMQELIDADLPIGKSGDRYTLEDYSTMFCGGMV